MIKISKIKTLLTPAIVVMAGFVFHAAAADIQAPAAPGNLVLWYDRPATDWQKEALPLGNGNLGCMVFGGIENEHIQFNHDALWVGSEQNTGAYQAFGDINIEFGHDGEMDYRRELDISKAVHTVTYSSKGTKYKREYFVSAPAQVMVFRFTADRDNAYSGTITLTDAHDAVVVAKGKRLTASGNTEKHQSYIDNEDPWGNPLILNFESQLLVINEGGKVHSDGNSISFRDCNSLMVLVSAGTDYLNQRARGWTGEHPHKRITANLDAASKNSFDDLLRDHVKDYQSLFNRLSIDIGETEADKLELPTDARMRAYRGKGAGPAGEMIYEASAVGEGGAPDPDLEELMFQYARYLMISCSRPGSLPSNLQGLWNNSNNPPWRCDYHSDVNVEMNYWFVDQANLSDCFTPLSEWFFSIRDVRKEQTMAHFKKRGFAMRAENGIFGGSTYKWSIGDASWITNNLWDHYAYTLDRDYLEKLAYPVLKDLFMFWEDHLKEIPSPDGKGTVLVAPDGWSPEHGPVEDGVSFDQQLAWDLLSNFAEASEVLGVDEQERTKALWMRDKLLGPQVGKWGQLQEWMLDRDDPDDKHRHLSHLIAVHPGRQISPLTTPGLAEAARVSMNARGDGATGWSKAWKISIWARLHDGNRAHKLLGEMLRGNVYDNLFDAHPPFQIDGNFGYASGVCEMLVQSHMGQIHLLPALPEVWSEGEIKGLRARGAFEIDMTWKEGELAKALIRSGKGSDCILRTGMPVTVTQDGKKVQLTDIENGVISFPTQEGKQYQVVPRNLDQQNLPVNAATRGLTYTDGRLSNGIIYLVFDPQGGFSIHDATSDEVLLSDARFALPHGKRGTVVQMYAEDIKDALGVGKRLTLEVADFNELGYQGRPNRAYAYLLYTYALYENNPALVCGFGVKMPNYLSFRLMESTPLGGGRFFDGKDMIQAMTLNGAAGATKTVVEKGLSRWSANSLMLTGLVEGQRRTAVWGGLRYKEFGAYATLQDGLPSFYAQDPIGRLVDEDESYLAEDNFYLDVHTRDPFEALERYGSAMRLANNAHPNVYDFPVLCGWSVSEISHLPSVNNSAKLIGELEYANKCGLTRYTKVALRLEPDKYHLNTEQGWWDDAHMREFRHLVEPYESIAKWSRAMNAANGIPYIYMQLGMPSDDFARQYPEYMLFNDASEVDKRIPNKPDYEHKHPHHQPYVTYDYTDKGFSDHFLKVWRKLSEDGIRGVKVDYPATAWRPEGGFDDRYATTNAAYRRAFELLREAMGGDAYIDERNLGESSRPCLDVTAGLVDTQRTWGDSNGFEPGMISISGLRWYKNRTVFNYYSDTKAVHDLSAEIRQSMLTMVFLSSGRLDLSTSFSLFTPEITRDVSRTYPHYPEPRTARPLDAFTGKGDPQVYDLELTPDWHQVALYNTGMERTVVSTAISGERVDNAIGLDSASSYHAYEFWSDTYIGKLSGTESIARELSPNCCAMISVRKAQDHPQVLSTDRHLLQGWLDLEEVRWDPETRTLSGTAHVIGGEAFKIVVADNGAKAIKSDARGGSSELKPHPVSGLSCLTLSATANTDVSWTMKYE